MILINIKEYNKYLKEVIEGNTITKDGEIIELHEEAVQNIIKNITIIEGTKEAERIENNRKQFNIKKEMTEFENTLRYNLGYFYFNFYNSIPKSIDKQFKFRFIFLCCYLKHDDTRLCQKVDNRYKFIKEGELMDLLKLKRTEYFETKKELINNNLIHIDNDGYIHINNKISFVGAINKNNKKDYTRIFKEGIKEIYNSSSSREHKRLALFIELLPYIHFDYNIICKNPRCESMQDVEALTINDIINTFTTDKNKSRVKKQLLDIKVAGQKTLLMITDDTKNYFVVNPKIYYKGNKINELNYLINLFDV